MYHPSYKFLALPSHRPFTLFPIFSLSYPHVPPKLFHFALSIPRTLTLLTPSIPSLPFNTPYHSISSPLPSLFAPFHHFNYVTSLSLLSFLLSFRNSSPSLNSSLQSAHFPLLYLSLSNCFLSPFFRPALKPFHTNTSFFLSLAHPSHHGSSKR